MKIPFIPLLILFATICSTTINAQEHSHDEHLGKLLTHYFEIKNALTSDNFLEAKEGLAAFAEEVEDSTEMNQHPEHALSHSKHHAEMTVAVNAARQATDIAGFRNSFDELTNELLKALENQGYTNGALYVQFCPMQNGGEGAKWISKEKKIMNPYFGTKMLGCGSVISTIE